MAKKMKTILGASSSAGKGDKPRPYDVDAYFSNFSKIKKQCGCTFGEKCKCKKQ